MQILLLVILLVASYKAVATQCPSDIPVVQATITQIYNGASQAYQWTISPIYPVNQPPSGSTACSAPGYISQFGGGTCQTNANQRTLEPIVYMNACRFSFSDGNGRTMTLALSCDASATTMQLAPTVSVTGQVGALTYAFSGTYAGVCDAPPQPTTTVAACPTNIVGVTTTITQFYAGVATDYEWTISPTSMINSAPADSDACTTAAYISQYTPNGHCDSTVTQKVGQPYRDGNACVYTFTDGLATVMTVSLQCNAASTTMDLANSVPLTLNGNTYNYAFTGSYAGVCTSPVPTYTSAVAPTQIIPSQCPTYVPAVTTTLSQIFNGLATPYEWTISPSAPINQPPSDANACTSAAFISQYTPGGSCDAAANVQMVTPYINNVGACVYMFGDGGSRIMGLTLSCDQASNTMNLSPTVPVITFESLFHFSFTGTYAGVCGSATSAPTQLTSQPSWTEPSADVSMWKVIAVASAAAAVIGITVALSIMLFRRKPSTKADFLAVDFLQNNKA